MKELWKQIKECQDCPFLLDPINMGRKEIGWGSGSEVMLIGQSVKGSGSRSDRFLLELMGEAGIRNDQICFTNISKTSIPSGMLMNQEQKEHCYGHVNDEVVMRRPKLIITLGSLAREWSGNEDFDAGLTGDFPLQKDGEVIRWKVPIYSIANPDAIKYNRITRKEIIKQIKNAINYGREIQHMDESGREVRQDSSGTEV